jgi:hypothetical protein
MDAGIITPWWITGGHELTIREKKEGLTYGIKRSHKTQDKSESRWPAGHYK